MSKIYDRKKILLAKPEVTYGTDSAPTGALNAIQTKDLTISPLEGDVLELDLDKPHFGANLQTLVGKHVMVTFKVPISGSGTLGTAPAWGVLFKGCGHAETIEAGVSVSYTPIDDDPIPSLVFYIKRDKVFHKITGSRGSVKATLDKKQYPWWEFTFMGLFNPPVAASAITPVYTNWIKPVPFRATTVDFSLIGQTVGLHNLSIDFGQKVEFYEHSEEESIQITDRQSTFQATFEETDIATHDFYNDINTETLGVLDYVHGIVAANIVEITSPQTQINKPTLQPQQGVSALQVSGPLTTDGTDPDYTVIAR